jgi:hypothetical protein
MIFRESLCGADGAVVSVTETEITDTTFTVTVDGVVVETRPATDADRARITPPEPTDSEKLATLLAALTDAQSLEEIRDAAAAAGGTP